MKRLLSLLLFCNITISFLLAQPVHQVKGTVIDKSSRQPLEFINVMIVGLNKGGVTKVSSRSGKYRPASIACKRPLSDTKLSLPPNTYFRPETYIYK